MPFYKLYGVDAEFITLGLNIWYLPLILFVFWLILRDRNKEYKEKNKKLTKIAEEYKRQRDEYKEKLKHEELEVMRLRLHIVRYYDIAEKGKKNKNAQFTQKEIDTLIRLCHPDKHSGKDSAKEITQKLLAMRGDKG